MDQNAYLFETLAGLLYLPVAARLLWQAADTRQTPERLLGATFGLYGLCYILFELPDLLGIDAHATAFYFAGRVAVAAGVCLIALFSRRVFRPREAWAVWLLALVIGVFVVALAVSALQGDWEGSNFHQLGFQLEWIAHLIPCVWICTEGAIHFARAERRRAIGLSDRATSHRFLLWGIFGLAQAGAAISILPMYIAYERLGYISTAMDALVGGFELLSISVVWITFYPPPPYQRWLEKSPPHPQEPR